MTDLHTLESGVLFVDGFEDGEGRKWSREVYREVKYDSVNADIPGV